MQKLIHEVLEDKAFAAAGIDDSVELRKEFYDNYDDFIKQKTISFITQVSADLNPAMRERIQSRVITSEGWRAFAKNICNNYLLSYNYMLSAFHNGGNKVFKVSADLAEALYNTDIEIRVEDIHPIFNSFIIYVDGDCLKDIGEYSPPFSPHIKKIQEYHVSYIMVEFLDSPYTEVGKILRMVFGYYDEGTDENDYMNWNNSSFLELEMNGRGVFKPKAGEKCGLGHFFPEQSLMSEEDREKAKHFNEAVINFIFSFMLYVSNMPEDVKLVKAAETKILTHNPKKVRRALKQSEANTKYNIYYVGQKYSGKYKASKEEYSGHLISHKTIVRGHWRDQWYGPRKHTDDGRLIEGQYQKTIWIEPFFKGIDMPESGKTTVFNVV